MTQPLRLVSSQELSSLHEQVLTAIVFGTAEDIDRSFTRFNRRAGLTEVSRLPGSEPAPVP